MTIALGQGQVGYSQFLKIQLFPLQSQLIPRQKGDKILTINPSYGHNHNSNVQMFVAQFKNMFLCCAQGLFLSFLELKVNDSKQSLLATTLSDHFGMLSGLIDTCLLQSDLLCPLPHCPLHQPSERQVVVGICAMTKKSKSKPMTQILERLCKFDYIDVVIFPEEVILEEPVERWPLCDCLISFHSKGKNDS